MLRQLLSTLLISSSALAASTNVLQVVSSNTFNTFVDVRLGKSVNPLGANALIGVASTGTNSEYKGVYASGTNLFPGKAIVADGTSAVPTVASTNSQSTGVFWPAADILGLTAGGNERLRVTSSQVYVTNLLATTITVTNLNLASSLAITNLTVTGTEDVGVLKIATATVSAPIVSGTYTPTFTLGANVTSATAQGTWRYIRIGANVEVFGRIAIACTASSYTSSVLDFTLPIASDFTTTHQSAGHITAYNSAGTAATSGVIYSDATNNRVEAQFGAINTSGLDYDVSFSYVIL